MATLASKNPTLLDVAAMPENKDVAEVVNLLAQFNPILEDAPAFPCNKGHVHQTTVRTGLPSPVWGELYKGIPVSKGHRQTVEDSTGFLESAAEVDTRLVDIHEKAEDKASIRFEEAQGHLEALAQEAATALFYHDTRTDPRKPMGFAPRFSALSGAENSRQIINAGGVGSDNASIWMITWDKKANHLIFPKSSKAGIQRKDMGVQPAYDADDNRYSVYREEFRWDLGLSVRDWRYVVRMANIDVSDLTTDASAGANLINLLTTMYYRHYGRRVNVGKTCLYMPPTIVEFLDHQARNVPKNLFLTFKETGINGKEVLHFRGIPIRETDALLETEAALT